MPKKKSTAKKRKKSGSSKRKPTIKATKYKDGSGYSVRISK